MTGWTARIDVLIHINDEPRVYWDIASMMKRTLFQMVALAFGALALSSCQTAAPKQAEAVSASSQPVPNIVQGVCGDCHGVEPPFLSPNPSAPSFAAIANRQGMSEASLTTWLVEAHNYPELMDFELSKDEAGEVARYLISLQDDGFEPAS